MIENEQQLREELEQLNSTIENALRYFVECATAEGTLDLFNANIVSPDMEDPYAIWTGITRAKVTTGGSTYEAEIATLTPTDGLL